VKAALRPDESAIAGIRRIYLSDVHTALVSLSGKGVVRDEAVHRARKSIKRARAALRLMRASMGDRFYRAENLALRDAARPLAGVRDAKILVTALQQVLDRQGKVTASVASGKLMALLRSGRVAARESALTSARLAPIRTILRNAPRRVQQWPLLEDDWDSLGPGIRRVYRSGRRALAAVKENRVDEALHEWRKQTKYLWHQLQILTPLAPGPVGELADEFHHLADYLGDEHDLAVLRGRLSGPVTDLIERRREELQDKAFALGARLYTEKSKAFVHELQQHWNAWERRRSARHQTAISAP
jgi:CHAD domain-containing protein